MAPETKDSEATRIGQIGEEEFQGMVQGVMREAARTALVLRLEEEVEEIVGAGCQGRRPDLARNVWHRALKVD
jgi:hypothetical protein